MTWLLFAVLAAFLWALTNIIDKITLSKLVKQPMTPVIVVGVLGLIAAGVVAATTGIEPFSPTQMLLGLLAGIAYTLMSVCYSKAVQLEEISKIIPLFALSPLFITVVAAITLHEVFSVAKYVGIAIVLVGAITLSVQHIQSFKFNKAFWLMVGSAASITATEIISKYLLGFHHYWSVFAFTRIGTFLAIIPIFWIYKDEIISLIQHKRLNALGFMTLSETFNLLALLSLIVASSIGYVTLVNAATQVQPFIVLALTVLMSVLMPHILKEEQGLKIFVRKFGSISLMFAGVVLLLVA
jgi:uncharacterized membrane protein